jgi:solute carrier family 25 uncoupling protein 8/9
MQVTQGPSNGSVVKEIKTILATEGISGLWKGLGPSMTRASALTASQLATYDESKQVFSLLIL